MWKVGQKLVCIVDASEWVMELSKSPVPCGECPQKGVVYTCDGYRKGKQIFLREFMGLTVNGERRSYFDGAFKHIAYSGNAISEILEKFKPEECRPDVEVIPEKLISNH